MSKKIILFDIDKTLYDSDSSSDLRNNEVVKVLNSNDIERIKFLKEKYRSTLKNEWENSPDDYLKLICDEFKSNKLKKLLRIYYGKEYRYTYSQFIYEDVVPVLNNLKTMYDLGIYSEGINKFQKNKFKSLGLKKYFKDDLVFIVEGKNNKKSIKKLPKGATVVDDKETICQFLTDNGFRAIWINRKDDRKSDNFETIYSLLELPAIL